MQVQLLKSLYSLETLSNRKTQGLISGIIKGQSFEPGSHLTIGGIALSEFIKSFRYKKVWCIWVVSDKFITPEDALMIGVNKAIGIATAKTGDHYSDLTGYLWTDDEGMIGGHDLVQVMECYKGKYGFVVIRENPIDLSKISVIE